MLKKLATFALTLIAISVYGDPVKLTNTTGATLTVEIDSLEGGEVTITQVADSRNPSLNN
jgi:hypothetical protein